MAHLHLYRNGKRIYTLEMGKRTYIVGREKVCDLVLFDDDASRQHFRLRPASGGGYDLDDLGSSNGTIVNGVREYRTRIDANATIQVGKALMLFEMGDEAEAPEEILELPEWALTTDERTALVDEDEEPATRPVPPAVLRKLQADTLARSRPHLLVRQPEENRVVPLDSDVTTIGLGPTRVSLGPTRKGKPKVLAEVIREGENTHAIRAKGLFARIQVNGRSTAGVTLDQGDVITIEGHTVEYHMGLTED